MKNTSKILALVLIVMTILMSLSTITASAAVEKKTYVFNPNDLGAIAENTYTDGQSVSAGTNNFFTLNVMAKSKNEMNKTHEFGDDFIGGKKSARFSLNGTSSVTENSIQRSISFTTVGKATVTVYWQQGNNGTRQLDLYGENLEIFKSESKEKGYYVSTFELDTAGTYYLAHSNGTVYFYWVEVTVEIETCDHSGGTATCKDQAICSKCEQPYGELSENHSFDKGACTVCGTPDPNACQHTNMAPATCTLPSTCADCGEHTVGDPLGHDMVTDAAVAPTCTEKGLEEGSHCSRCDEATTKQKEVDALGHTLTFVNTLPTADAAGKTIADCSVCKEHFDFGEVKVMGAGTYVLDAAKLEGIAQYSLFDGEVKVVDGVFACHLSYKYRTDANVKTFAADDWVSTHRMNFGGQSQFIEIGEGEEAVRNGGLNNFIQIVTTGETTITFWWGVGDNGREMAVYDMEGNLVAVTEFEGAKNDLAYSTLTVAAGTYLIGTDNTNAVKEGGNYIYKMEVVVDEPEVEEPGEQPGEQPSEQPSEQPELTFIQKIMAFIMSIIEKILVIFKK